MPILLPTQPPAKQSFRLVSSKNVLEPAFGGGELELRRKGSRYEFAYDYGEMDYLESLAWSDLHVEGDTLVAPVFQPGLDVGEPGAAPVVNGSGQIGAALRIRALRPGYWFRKGQFLSVVNGGVQRFLYRVFQATQVLPDGTITLPLYTLLRRPHPDGSVVEIKEPKIEGYPRDVSDTEIYDNHNVEVSFKIRERE